MAHFFAMGGYAAFVWPAYGASLVGIGAIVVATLRSYARAKRALSQIEESERS